MKTFSLTYKGAIVGAISLLLRLTGVEVAETDITDAVTATLDVIAFVVIIIGRYRAGGVTLFGVKK